ncbi:hypothetical protein CAEBREN_07698 [Caenorhabditis brenneri]|uniref:Uncharacterized protein n=1 Tax=Caenorhabditis brenneri TaxID=135651 RepID=G0NPJ7_CAEBE|nr:hypothetical protein CAEBREN_07698 [Caenorhabditis brenneri]
MGFFSRKLEVSDVFLMNLVSLVMVFQLVTFLLNDLKKQKTFRAQMEWDALETVREIREEREEQERVDAETVLTRKRKIRQRKNSH